MRGAPPASLLSFGAESLNHWKMCREAAYRFVLDEVRAATSKSVGRKRRVGAAAESIAEPVSEPATQKATQPIIDGQEHVKEKLLEHLDSITTALLAKAKAGGTAPLRLLWELGKLHQDATATPRRRTVSLSRLLMREIRDKELLKKQIKSSGK